MQALEELGLTTTEAKIYLALLELGESATGKLIDKTKLQSSTIYNSLGLLIKKGLITYVHKGKIKYYSASPPETFNQFLEEKKQLLNEVMPKLKNLEKVSSNKQNVKLYEGIKGLKVAFKDILDTLKKGETYRFFQVDDMTLHRPEVKLFFRNFHLKRAEKGIKVKAVANKVAQKKEDILKGVSLIERKYINEITPTGVVIYKNKVILIDWKETPVLIVIESESIAKNYVDFFEEKWNQETYIVKGIDAIQDLFEDMLEEGHCDFIGARGYFVEKKPEYIKNWEERAKKTGFTMRNITDHEMKDHKITKFSFAQTKYTLNPSFSHLSVFWIFKNKVAISNWIEKEPIAMIIENKSLVKMYKKQFELLWKEN